MNAEPPENAVLPAPLHLATRPASSSRVSTDTIAYLRQLLTEAEMGHVQGVAVAALREGGAYSLSLKGEAMEESNLMAVAGMLGYLRKMVFDLEGNNG